MASRGTETTCDLEVWRPGGVQVVLLTGATVTIGRTEDNGVVLDHDGHVSPLHAALQAYGTGWAIRDLGSTNGTTVGGERLVSERALESRRAARRHHRPRRHRDIDPDRKTHLLLWRAVTRCVELEPQRALPERTTGHPELADLVSSKHQTSSGERPPCSSSRTTSPG